MRENLHVVRDAIARQLVGLGRRVATDAGWTRLRRGLGAPSMSAGLSVLRERGVELRAVIDGGACVGAWCTLLKRHFPQAQVLMIEAQPRHRAALEQVCRRFGPSVCFADALLGPRAAERVAFTVLDDDLGGTGSSVMPENSDVPRHTITLPMTTLDDLVHTQKFPVPDLIKLDVQGFEIEVLKGAARLLATVPFVLLEVSVWQYNAGSPLWAEVLGWMEAAGYVSYEVFDLTRRRDGILVQIDILFVRKDSPLLADRMTSFAR